MLEELCRRTVFIDLEDPSIYDCNRRLKNKQEEIKLVINTNTNTMLRSAVSAGAVAVISVFSLLLLEFAAPAAGYTAPDFQIEELSSDIGAGTDLAFFSDGTVLISLLNGRLLVIDPNSASRPVKMEVFMTIPSVSQVGERVGFLVM